MFPPVSTRSSLGRFTLRLTERRLTVYLLAGVWCTSWSPLRAELPPLGVWVAEKVDGVSLKGYSGAEPIAVPPELALAKWRRFDLRGPSPNRSGLPDGVAEVRGDFPRIRVRSEYQIISFAARTQPGDPADGVEGIAAIGSWGPRVLLGEPGDRFEVEEDGASVSPDQRFLAIIVRGTDERELFVLNLRPGIPTVEAVHLPPGLHLLPKSLTLIDGALFVVAELPSEDRVVLRAPLESGVGGPLAAEILSPPFSKIEPIMAGSPAAVAYLAGESDDLLDVYVARAAGAPLNLTECPSPYIKHRWGDQRLAVSDDGGAVAYSVRMEEVTHTEEDGPADEYGPEPETFCHLTALPGMEGRVHLTSNENFLAYVEQEALIFFRGSQGLVFSAGHVGEKDMYMFSPLTSKVKNLTLTAGAEIPYGLGTLTPSAATVTRSGLMLIAADGFDGQPGVVGVSADTGDQVFKQVGLEKATGFFDVGDDTYFVAESDPTPATAPAEALGLYRVRAGALARVFSSGSSRKSRLLIHDSARALLYVKDEGVLELRPGEPPTTVIAGDVRPAVALSPCGDRLVYSREDDVYVQDLTGGGGPWRLEMPSSEKHVLAVGEAFVRGDADDDGQIGFEDAFAILAHLSLTRPASCADAADANDDGTLNLADFVVVANHTLVPGASLPPPFPDPGVDPTPDGLSCCR